MKILRKAKRIDVKRAYLMAHVLRKFGIAEKNSEKIPKTAEYAKAFSKAQRFLEDLDEEKLDVLILEKKFKSNIKKFREMRQRRLDSYNNAKWFIADVPAKNLGVWKGAGNLPKSWTGESLDKLSVRVRKGLKKNSRFIKYRAIPAIPAILKLISVIKKDKYSLPIVFESGMGTNGRRGLPKTKFDIDDGNMRAIAYAINGDKTIKCYVGFLKK